MRDRSRNRMRDRGGVDARPVALKRDRDHRFPNPPGPAGRLQGRMSSPELGVAGTGVPLPTTTKRNQRWAADPPRPLPESSPPVQPLTKAPLRRIHDLKRMQGDRERQKRDRKR